VNSVVVPAYQINRDDLPDLDPKAAAALRPLLENLNNVMRQLVVVANSSKDAVTALTGFTTSALGAAYVELSNPLSSMPRCVVVAELQRRDGRPVDNVYGFWWTRTANGIRALFVGLDATTSYSYALRVQ
jgi:hypothetical protein